MNSSNNIIDNPSHPENLLKYNIVCYTTWFDHNGDNSWKRCDLLKFNKENFTFTIRIIKSNLDSLIKDVTRFNIKFEKQNEKRMSKRIEKAKNHRNIAQKYLALYHFISSFDNEKLRPPFYLVDNLFRSKILFLSFCYESNNYRQYSPLEYEKLPHIMKYGIWRRHSKKKEYPDFNYMKRKIEYYFKNSDKKSKISNINNNNLKIIGSTIKDPTDLYYENLKQELLESVSKLNIGGQEEEEVIDENEEDAIFRKRQQEKEKYGLISTMNPKQKLDYCHKLLDEFTEDYLKEVFSQWL